MDSSASRSDPPRQRAACHRWRKARRSEQRTQRTQRRKTGERQTDRRRHDAPPRVWEASLMRESETAAASTHRRRSQMEPSCEALMSGGFTSVLTAKEQRTLLEFLTGP